MAGSLAKAGIIGGVAVAVLGGAWLGAGIVGARQTEAQLRPLIDHPLGNGQWRLVNLQHQAGLVTSSGSVDLRLEHALMASGDGPVVARIDYRVSHLPLLSGIARFHWSVKPAGELADPVGKALGPDFMLQGDGRVSSAGVVATDLRLSEIALAKDGDSLKATPASGTLVVDGNAMTLHWHLDRVEQSGQGESFTLEGAAADVAMVDYKEGTGTSSFTLDKITASAGSLGGLKLMGEAVDHDDRRDVRLATTVANVQAAGYTAKDLSFEIAAKGLDRQSLKTLITLSNSLNPVAGATAEQLATARAASAVLLKKGFSLGIPHLAGSAMMASAGKPQTASVDANVSLDLAPTSGNGVSLATQLKSHGVFNLIASGLLKEERQMALAQGLVTVTPEGMKADYALADGNMTLNGQPYDPSAVALMLATAEQQINHFLDPQAFPLEEATGVEDKADPAEGEPDAVQPDAAPMPPAR